MDNSKIAQKMQRQIEEFSGILSVGLPKVSQRLVGEVIYGIQARGSVRLTEIGRALHEKISLHKTQDRLCRQLKREGLGEKVRENLLGEGAKRIKEETLLIVDISDLSKKYAEKMEYMSSVYDGSEGTVGRGYWSLQIIGAEVEEVEMTPLYGELYSQDAPGFKSENQEILKGIESVRRYTQGRGIYVIDRGGDRRKLIEPLLEKGLRFIIRLVGDRHLIYRGERISAKELALRCPMFYIERIIKEEKHKEKVYHLEFGYRKVKLPGYKEQLYLVAIRGFGEEPLMILTNVEIKKSRSSLLSIVLSYMKRWQIEETIRFAKQSYTLEDIRLLSYNRLRNMMVLVTAAMYFAAVWLGSRLRLKILLYHALKAAKRLFGIPNFRYYAIADGVKEIFAKYSGQIFYRKKISKEVDPQMKLLLH
jgi:hypothetical protein